MKSFKIIDHRLNLAVVILILFSSSTNAQHLKQSSLIKNNLDGSQTLLNHVPREVERGSAIKTAHANSNKMLDLRIVLPSKDQAGLDKFLKDLYDPKSPVYHKFLTPTQFAQQFGASDVDSSIVKKHLQSAGLTVKGQSKNGFILRVAAPVTAVERNFKLNINNYKKSDGTPFFAPDANPTIPIQIAGKIRGISGMDNLVKYKPHCQRVNAKPQVQAPILAMKGAGSFALKKTSPSSFSIDGVYMGPADIATAYGLSTVSYKGSGQTLAVYELDGYNPADILSYETKLGLPHVNIQNVYINGFTGSAGSNADEVVLDVELVIAVAPQIATLYVYQADQDPLSPTYDSNAWLDEWDQIATDDLAKVISVSWGGYEQLYDGYDHGVFEQLASQGQTVFASSGDAGAYDNCPNGDPTCQGGQLSVDDPASDPYVTGVGISVLSVNNDGTFKKEIASTIGGGGISQDWEIPTYQQALTPSNHSLASTTMRNVPDVSLNGDPFAGPAYGIWYTDPTYGANWYGYGGSSAATPIWAAFMARVNQSRVAAGLSVIGFLNPILYQIANGSNYTQDFHDITSGNNSFYSAGTGYDDATGLGSFNGSYLLPDLLAYTGPQVPAGLNATASDTQVNLFWRPSSNAVSYNIKRSDTTGGPYSTLNTPGSVTGVNYTDNTNIAPNHFYYYVITAVNTNGESPNSLELGGETAPPTPTGLNAVPTNHQVALTWNPSSNATGYFVGRSSTQGGPYTLLNVSLTTNLFYTDSSATNGHTFYYVVAAANNYSVSNNSSEVTALMLPATPTNLIATPGDAQVGLTWDAPLGAQTYNVKRSSSSGGVYTTLPLGSGVSGTSFTDSNLINTTTYYYEVSAVNNTGEGLNSASASATPHATVPSPPTGLTATKGDGVVTLNWTSSNGATSYKIYRGSTASGENMSTPIHTVTGAVTYPDTSVTNGLTYYYVITAVNTAGESGISNEAHATPQVAIPSAPTGLTASAGDSQVTLNWTASNGATSYKIYRGTTASGENMSSAIHTVTGATTYPDTSAVNGQIYYYVITAVNAGGESGISNEAHATPQLGLPSPPSGLTASAGNAQVTLNWTASNGATSYNIYRGTSASGENMSSPIHTVIGTTTYPDTGLTNSQTYYYVITAVNLTGESGVSNEAHATPVLPPDAPLGVTATKGDSVVTLNWSASNGATSYKIYRGTTAGGENMSTPIHTVTGAVTYPDTSVTNGQTYYYVITALNAGGESPVSSEVHATPQVAAPSAPLGLTASAGNTQVTLNWSATNGATSYNIYRGTSHNGEDLTTPIHTVTGATTYPDTSLNNYQTYYYVITAVNAGGESGYSSEASAMPTPAPIDGVCGAASKTYAYGTTSFGVDALCAVGSPNPSTMAFPGAGQTVSWACQGINGGANSSCSAKQNPKIIFRR